MTKTANNSQEICDLIKTKKCVLTSELGPPKGTNFDEFNHHADILKDIVDAANVTDQQAAVMRLSSLGACIKLRERGMNPILQLTVRDRNRMALQAELLAASSFGINNVLVLSGDPIKIGDHPDSKVVFDLDAVGLMNAIRTLESGVDLGGKKLNGSPEFCIAAAANPCVEDLDTEFSKMHNKIKNGAEFFQTQGIFEASAYERFHKRLVNEKIEHPILAGIILLKSAKMARFMNEKIPGIVIPQNTIDALEKSNDLKSECVRIASETIIQIKDKVAGFHLMAIGWEELIPRVIKQAGL